MGDDFDKLLLKKHIVPVGAKNRSSKPVVDSLRSESFKHILNSLTESACDWDIKCKSHLIDSGKDTDRDW